MERIINPERLVQRTQDAPSFLPAKQNLQHGQSPIISIQYAPNGRLLSAARSSKYIHLWDVSTGEIRLSLKHQYPVTCFARSPDGLIVVSSDKHRRMTWDLSREVLLSTVEMYDYFRHGDRAMTFSSVGQRLAYAYDSDFCSWGSQIGICDIEDNAHDWGASWDQPFVEAMAYSPDGRWLVTGWGFGIVRIYDINNENDENHGREYEHRNVDFSMNENDRNLPAPVKAVCFSPCGEFFVVACGLLIEFRRINDRRVFARLAGHQCNVNALAFAENGLWLISGSDDGTVKYWNVAARRNDRTINWDIGEISAIAVSPDGKTFAAGGAQGRIVFWTPDFRRYQR